MWRDYPDLATTVEACPGTGDVGINVHRRVVRSALALPAPPEGFAPASVDAAIRRVEEDLDDAAGRRGRWLNAAPEAMAA